MRDFFLFMICIWLIISLAIYVNLKMIDIKCLLKQISDILNDIKIELKYKK